MKIENLHISCFFINFAVDLMDKKKIYHIVEWIIALAACAFLIWKIVTYDDYASLWATLQAMSWSQWLAIIACIALMPLNMSLEAWRWKTLLPMSWREAHRQVYYSKLAGLITPWKLGEYPARAVLMEGNQESGLKSQETWAKVLSMGVVGSATMTAVIIACGAIAMISDWRLEIEDWKFSYLIIIALILLLLGVALYFAPRLLRRWAEVSHKLVAISLGQSFVRLLCWCIQLALVLWALDSFNFQLSTFNLFIYYLLVTITPNVPIAEVGVRGAWAIILFGSMNAALAGVLLWGINTLLPCLAWFFLKKK